MQEYVVTKSLSGEGNSQTWKKITEKFLHTETFFKLEVDTGILRLHRGCKQLVWV